MRVPSSRRGHCVMRKCCWRPWCEQQDSLGRGQCPWSCGIGDMVTKARTIEQMQANIEGVGWGECLSFSPRKVDSVVGEPWQESLSGGGCLLRLTTTVCSLLHFCAWKCTSLHSDPSQSRSNNLSLDSKLSHYTLNILNDNAVDIPRIRYPTAAWLDT